jgi:hypothetical protein
VSRRRRRSGRPGGSRDRTRPNPPAPRQRGPRPGPTRPVPVSPTPGARAALERISYPLLARIAAAPKVLVGLVAGAVLLGGLLAPPPWGPLLLIVVAAFLAWLVLLSWPALDPRGRLIRLVTLVLVVGAAVVSWNGA